MPVQLKRETEKIHGGGFIDAAMMLKMIDYYRKNRKDKNTLKFAHYAVAEVLDLFVRNGVFDPSIPYDDQDVSDFGIKVYMANHANDEATCPAGRATDYKSRDTVIFCNTMVDEEQTWNDMLQDGKDWVSLPGIGGDGPGADKGSVCPPDCPGAPDPDGNLQTDISSN